LKVSSSAVTNTNQRYYETGMRTATGKEDPELPLLQRISSLQLPASEIANYLHFRLHLTKVKLQTHLNINCSEETA
jgi:hypothetical protein